MGKQTTCQQTPAAGESLYHCCIHVLCHNRPVQASYTSVIAAGDPLQPTRPPIPLENLPAGTFDPVYRLPLDVQGGELPVLPLSIAGAVSMTHLPDTEAYLSGDEWFVFKFDKQQAGLSGMLLIYSHIY